MIGTFTKGQRVRVYPHGGDTKAATGEVVIISPNQRAIMVLFQHFPPFTFVKDGWLVDPDHGITFCAERAIRTARGKNFSGGAIMKLKRYDRRAVHHTSGQLRSCPR